MLFSIIIPVYNVKSYLKECVESVIQQDLDDYEILLIDDGSTDGSAELCDKLEQENQSVTTIHKPNGGAASARNLGIQQAKGDYLIFIDGDDILVNPFALSIFKDVTTLRDPDIICFDYVQLADRIIPTTDLSIFHTRNYHLISAEQITSSGSCNYIPKGACAAVVNNSFAKRNNLEFPEGVTGEDIIWALKLCALAKTMCFIDCPIYLYRIDRVNSVTTTASKAGLEGYCMALEYWCQVDKDFRTRNKSIDLFATKSLLILLLNYDCVDGGIKQHYRPRLIRLLNGLKTRNNKYILFTIRCLGCNLSAKIIHKAHLWSHNLRR